MLRKTIITGAALGMLAALGLGSVRAAEHNHPPQHAAIHDEFYSKWNKPNGGAERTQSCCNKQDCIPTRISVAGGVCKAWKPDVKACGDYGDCVDIPAHWVVFDCMRLEEYQKDPHDSPDGKSHACIAVHTDTVYCAVRGSLQ